jgi:hypothetical protein
MNFEGLEVHLLFLKKRRECGVFFSKIYSSGPFFLLYLHDKSSMVAAKVQKFHKLHLGPPDRCSMQKSLLPIHTSIELFSFFPEGNSQYMSLNESLAKPD